MTDLIAELEGVDRLREASKDAGGRFRIEGTPEFVDYTRKLLALYRDHHAEIAAAVRDARGERSESWEVWQDDMPVAGSDSIADAKHYLMMYGQDGPVKLVRKVEYRETVTPEQITAMRAGEGEG